MKFLGILQILACYSHVLGAHHQGKEIIHGRERHILRRAQKGSLRLLIAHRLDAVVPFEGVHTEDRLLKRHRHRDSQETV